jgi:2'-5' RNA ligase
MTATIAEQTYAVLDLPDPVAGKVMAIRQKHRDAFRSALPAEVTVVGSSGVGCFTPGSVAAYVLGALDRIAGDTRPIQTSLDGVHRFPQTDIFVFLFTDKDEIRQLHERIAGSGLSFLPNPWPFEPHVTLRSRSPVTDDEAASLLAERIPEPFKLDQLSVYELREDPSGATPVICELLHRTRLGTEDRQ